MRILATVVALAGLSGLARAEPTVSVGVEGGLMSTADQAGGEFGLRGGVGFLGPTRLEARYLRTSFDVNGRYGTASELAGQLRLTIPTPVVKPYGFLGLGRQFVDVGLQSDSAWVMPFGGGLDLPINSFFVVAPEFTWHKQLTDMAPLPGDSWNVALVLRLDL